MKQLLLTLAAAVGLSAQYVEILGTDYPANSLGQLNKKMSSRVGSGAPSGACTAGLDFYLNSTGPAIYVCPAGSWVLYSSGSGGTWGSITGTLSSQTDLQSALDGKISTGGLAGTAAALATPRAINGTNFDGTAAITITASLPSNPAACPGGEYVTDIAADGTLTCAAVSGGAHTQNTDSGTTQTSFQIDSGNTGPRIKNSSGTLQVRNAADGALANLTAATITADSFTTSGSGAGSLELTQGTAPTAGTTSVKLYAHSAVTSYIMRLPSAAGTGFILGTNTAGDVVQTFVASTGSGDVVRATSPTLVTPALGTPSAAVLTNATGLPIGGITGLGTGIGTLLATPSSANLATAITDETGSGAAVFANSPTLVTPALGTPSALVATNATGTAAGLTAGAATALAADPTDCSANQPAVGVNAAGTASCATLTATVVKSTSGVLSAAVAGTDYVIPSGSVATLSTARAIYGNNFDGSAALTQRIASTYLPAFPIGVAVGDPAGSALATGVLGYAVAPAACTIAGWDIVVDAGTATVDVWKVATGTAKPTVANTITASAKPAISTGTAIASTTLTAWTTSVAAGDIFGFNLDAVATAKYITIAVRCQ